MSCRQLLINLIPGTRYALIYGLHTIQQTGASRVPLYKTHVNSGDDRAEGGRVVRPAAPVATAVPHSGERGECGFDSAAPLSGENQAEAASFLVEAIAFHSLERSPIPT